MKLFETEHLGRFKKSEYTGNEPSEEVEEFRREKIITALNRYAWENRDDEFSATDVDFSEIPVIRAVLESHDWDDVARLFEDFDPRQWDAPPQTTAAAPTSCAYCRGISGNRNRETFHDSARKK